MLEVAHVYDEGDPLVEGYAGQHFVGIDLHRRSTQTPRGGTNARLAGGRSSDVADLPVMARLRDSATCARLDQTPATVSALVLPIAGACSGNPA
jgi:hypothetical protein